MSKKIQAIRGMNDIKPNETPVWQYLEGTVKELLASYGYGEIRMPIVEQTNLFKRSIGEVTDIVEKEMYTFEDRNGDSLTLRPEGTASCVRACEEHGLLYNQTQRLWYTGPMFRHERPQKGRYRQFHQQRRIYAYQRTETMYARRPQCELIIMNLCFIIIKPPPLKHMAANVKSLFKKKKKKRRNMKPGGYMIMKHGLS